MYHHNRKMEYSEKVYFTVLPILLLGASNAQGQDAEIYKYGTTIQPSLTVSVTWTDNVALTNENEQSEFITSVIPSLRLSRNSKRINLVADYGIESLFYAKDSDRNELYHKLQAATETKVYDEWLYLDGDAFYSQHSIDPEGRVAYDNLPVTDNRTDVWSVGLSPYVMHEFGNGISLRAGTRVREVSFKSNNVQDRSQLDWFIDIGNKVTWPGKISWSLNYLKSEVKREILSDSTFESAYASLEYTFNSKYQAYLKAGREKNRFDLAEGRKTPEGSVWYAGLIWRPTRQTFVDGSVGRRYFGTTKRLSATHQGARLGLSLKYAEELTTTTQLLTRLDTEAVRAEIATQKTGNEVEILQLSDYALPSFTVNTYLGKRLDATISYRLSRTRLDLRAYDARREYQEITGNDTSKGIVFGIFRQLRPFTQAEMKLHYADRNSTRGLDSKFKRISLIGRHRLSRRIEASAAAIREERSGSASTDYKMNMVYLTATIVF